MFSKDFVYKCDFSLTVTHYLEILSVAKYSFTVKPNVACGVKADRLPSVRWKDIPHVHFTDHVILVAYRCIEEDNFNCKLQALPLLIAFVANSVGGIFLKRRQSVFPLLIGFGCRVIVSNLSMPLYMFVFAAASPLSLVDGVAFAVLSDVLSAPRVSSCRLFLCCSR